MQTSEQGRAFIKAWEVLRLQVYKDAVGKLTVGWGHLIVSRDALKAGDRIAVERAEALFASDLVIPEDAIEQLPREEFEQHEFDALVSFVFNEGVGNFGGSTLRRMLLWGTNGAAAEQFARWNKGHLPDGSVVVLDGLTKRRAAEKRMFLSGVYDATH